MDKQIIIFELNLRREQWLVDQLINLLLKMQLTFLTGYLELLTFIVLRMGSKF